MKKNSNFMYFLFFIILGVLIYSIYFNSIEGFYTSENITNSTTKLNDLLTGNLENLKTVITDIMNQKYKLSINEVVNSLNNEYKKDSKIYSYENQSANVYLKTQINNINVIQQNLNNLNKKIDTLFETIKVDITDFNTNKVESYSLLEAINKTKIDIKAISSSLSQIPS